MTKVISLGSSCDTANTLKRIGIQSINFYFDFIWNEYDGLKTVNKMIQNNFEHLSDIRNYTKSPTHPDMNFKDFNINKYYPNVIFMHHDISKQCIIDSLNRKIDRTRNILSNNEKKVFIYYRHYHRSSVHIPNCTDLNVIIEETLDFCKIYKKLFSNNFYILSLIMIDPNTESEKELLLLKSKNNENIKFDYVYRRNDTNTVLNQLSINRWDYIIKKYQIK